MNKTCPRCGENKDMILYVSQGILNKGIMGGLVKLNEGAGWPNRNYKNSRVYVCKTCGKEWEEPYD